VVLINSIFNCSFLTGFAVSYYLKLRYVNRAAASLKNVWSRSKNENKQGDGKMEQSCSGTSVPIVGAWKLISFEIQKTESQVIYPFGENAQGSIIYTQSGRFSVQVMRPARPAFASGDQIKGTIEEIEINYKGFISYYGFYEFDRENGFVVHHVEGSLFPNWEGQSQKRFFKLSDNRLELSTPPTLWGGGGEVIGILLWERIE